MSENTTLIEVRLAGGFEAADQAVVDEALVQLRRRVDAMDRTGIEMEVSAKDRDAPGQKVTLELWVPGVDKFVATSEHPDLRAGLNEVGDRVLAQLNQNRERQEPRNNRQRRETIRTSD